MPTAIASDSARQRWTRARLCSPEIQGESPGRGRGAAVEGDRQLQGDERQAGAGVLAEGLVEEAGGGRLLAGGEGRPRRRRRGGSRGRGRRPSRRGRRRRSPPARARLEDRVDAGRLAALVRAGLERHVHRRPGGVVAALRAVGERRPLRVQAAERRVEPLARAPRRRERSRRRPEDWG